MNRATASGWTGFLLTVCGVLVPAIAAAAQPNVIVILSDDQGWGDLSLHGNPNLSTPNIDSLAEQGAQFERFYVCPVCSPTRAEFLTGRYHPRSGVYSTSAGGERMDLDERTIADLFRAGGYRTAAFGKWHNGMQYPYHPNGRGFDEFYGFCSGHWGNYFDPMLERNGQIVRGDGFCIDDFTSRAIDFISDSSSDKPFFVYLPYNTPHSPMQVPDRWWNRFRDFELKRHNRNPEKENIGHIRAALAMCENIDWNVGRILQALDERNLAEETIVVYFCDNGPNGTRWNGDMKGRKGSTDEGGVRSPLLIRWPRQIPAGTRISTNAAAIDLLPTLAELAGVEVAGGKPLDGISLKPLFHNAGTRRPPRRIFSHWRGRVAVRTENFLLDHQGQLFSVRTDPGQRKNISRERPGVTAELRAAVADWKSEVLPGLEDDSRPFLVGHPDFRVTQIPARDGTPHGSIRRSNRFPNCSYFLNWNSLDDRMTWDVEVLTSGDYEIEVYYTCPQADVGAEIELSFGESRVRGKVSRPHDPPLQGAGQDRVPRAESYVKEFRPLKLGTIRLNQGSGTLSLRALSVPGSQVMEFRLMMLTRATKQSR